MSGFHDVSFPASIALGAKGGPEWPSDVIQLASGVEVRNVRWAAPRRRWQIGTAALSLGDLQTLSDFFISRRGPVHSFRFTDPFDHIADTEPVGIGDGEQMRFPLLKQYGTVQRRIALPKLGSLEIFVDGHVMPTGWAFDTATREVEFEAPPALGAHISASFQFECAVRFENTRFESVIDAPNAARLNPIGLIEVLEV